MISQRIFFVFGIDAGSAATVRNALRVDAGSAAAAASAVIGGGGPNNT